MGLKTYIKKAANGYYWWLDKLNKQAYIEQYPKYLRSLGVDINEHPGDCWISPTIFLDSSGYDMITIGDDCTISFEVAILIHDYSINNAFRAQGIPEEDRHRLIKRPVSIGNNCFIGARATILPGATIGDNCIVGSGSVVRGHIPSGSIVSGNPATVIGNVADFAQKHIERQDFEYDFR